MLAHLAFTIAPYGESELEVPSASRRCVRLGGV